MIDAHLHLSYHLFDAQFPYLARNIEGSYTIQQGTRKELMGHLLAAGVSCCINPGISIVSNEKLQALAEQWPGLCTERCGYILPAPGNTKSCRGGKPAWQGSIGKSGESRMNSCSILPWLQLGKPAWITITPEKNSTVYGRWPGLSTSFDWPTGTACH